jgi:hypothetical protein
LIQFRIFLALFGANFCLFGAQIDQREAVLRQMEASLAAQKASVARQTTAPSGSFFLLPPLGHPVNTPPDCAPLEKQEFSMLVDRAARRQDLQPELLQSVARAESGLRPCAVSPKGAMGLMQLMPATAKDLGVDDPFDPAQNIEGGARLLRKYLDMYRSLPLALGAYNAGPARVNQTGQVPRIPETVEYVRRILSFLPK